MSTQPMAAPPVVQPWCSSLHPRPGRPWMHAQEADGNAPRFDTAPRHGRPRRPSPPSDRPVLHPSSVSILHASKTTPSPLRLPVLAQPGAAQHRPMSAVHHQLPPTQRKAPSVAETALVLLILLLAGRCSEHACGANGQD